MEHQSAAVPAPVPAAGAPDAAAGPPKTCPSAACGEGALLLGAMTSSGKVAYLHPPVPVDADFAAREVGRGTPERRYRFAGPCLEGGCPQWTGRGCAIADMVADPVNLGLPASPSKLPACGIRHSCRWYFQRGPAACAACPLIVADMGGTDTYQSVKAEAYDHDPDAWQLPSTCRAPVRWEQEVRVVTSMRAPREMGHAVRRDQQVARDRGSVRHSANPRSQNSRYMNTVHK